MQPRTKQDQLHFGYQKLCLPRNESASLKTKMFSTRQIVCHLPADFLAVKKEFSWLKNCCSSLSATCKSLWNFEQRENKKNGSTTPFFLSGEWWLVTETLPMLQTKFSYGVSFQYANKETKICFSIPIFFSNLNYNCLLEMRNLQE